MNQDAEFYSYNDIKECVKTVMYHQKKNEDDPNNFFSKGVEALATEIFDMFDTFQKVSVICERADAVRVDAIDYDGSLIAIIIVSRSDEPVTNEEKPLIEHYYRSRHPYLPVSFIVNPDYNKTNAAEKSEKDISKNGDL